MIKANRGDAMERDNNRGAWVIGGTTLIGTGVGLIFLYSSALLFVACILIGIGAGLLIAQLIAKDKSTE